MAEAAPQQAPETVRVYDDAGQALDLAPAEAEAALRRGDVGFRADQEVVLRGEDGRMRTLTGEEAAQALGSYQNRLGTSGGLAEQEQQDRYGGALQGARAAAAGWFRAGTGGASDEFFSAVDPTLREDLAGLQRYRPGATMAGEGAMLLGSALVTGGSSLAARGATALPRAIMAGGQFVERGVARALLAAGATEGGLVARAVPLALGQAVEMGAYSAGQEISRAALANENLSGERLYSAFGHGALLGAAGGGLIGAAGYAGNRAINAAVERGAALKERAIGAVEGLGTRAAEFGSKVAEGGNTLIDKGLQTLTKGKELAPTLEGKVRQVAEELAPGGLKSFGEQKLVQSTGASTKQIGELRAMGAPVEARVVKQLDELPTLLGKEKGAILSHPEMAQAAEKAVEQTGAKIGDSLKALDAAGTTIKPDLKAIVSEANETIIKDLLASPFTKNQGKQLEALVKDIEAMPAPSFEELHRQRRLLDRRIRFEAQNPTVGQEALRDLRNIIEREIERSAEAASKEIGAEFAQTYKAAKEQYGAAKWIAEATETGAKREMANASVGLREIVSSVSGANVGSAVGGALLGPVGSVVGGAVGGVANAYLANLSKRYGDQAVAAVIRRLGAGATVADVATGVMDEVMGKAVSSYLKNGAKKALDAGRAGLRNVAETAEELRKSSAAQKALNVREGASNAFETASGATRRGTPAALSVADEYRQTRDAIAAAATATDRTARINAELPPGTSPKTAEAANATAQRAVAYLQAQMPTEIARGRTLTPAAASRLSLPPADEMARFLVKARAVSDPMTLIEDVANGHVSRDAVDAVQAVYPEFFANLQERVQMELSMRPTELTYEQEADLSRLLGVVGHPSFDPGFIARQQAVFVQATTSTKGAPPPQGNGRPIAPLYDPDHKEYPS